MNSPATVTKLPPPTRKLTAEAMASLMRADHPNHAEAQRVLVRLAVEADAVATHANWPREELAMIVGWLRRLVP